jgi:branched-chain amino acid transport system permease protein
LSPHSTIPRSGAPGGIAIALSLQDIVLGLAVLVLPFVLPDFFVFQIAAQALVLGVIATSLAFLVGAGGLVSLAQMSVAGIAAYLVAIFGSSSVEAISLNWPWWLVVPLALAGATVLGTLIGLVAIRTEGIYTIMITIAIGVALYYLTQQNYALFNGFQGFAQVTPPALFGVAWNAPRPFYYLAAAVAAASFLFHRYILGTPFGLSLQGTRDNPRRMRALGFDVNAHRVAAYAVAAFIAALGGVLLVWYNGRVSPGTLGTGAMFNILIIAVLGGIRSPAGPFVGALVFVLLQNFAIDLVDRERFNLVIGGVFLAAVLFSPDGLIGMWKQLSTAATRRRP